MVKVRLLMDEDVVEITVGRCIAVYDKAGDGMHVSANAGSKPRVRYAMCWGRKRRVVERMVLSDVDGIDGWHGMHQLKTARCLHEEPP